MFDVYEEFGQCRVATKPVSILFSTITDVMMFYIITISELLLHYI